MRRWRLFIWGCLLWLAFGELFLFPLLPAPHIQSDRPLGLWIRSNFHEGKYSRSDLADLALRLMDHRVGYAYFHVRSVDRTGKLVFPPSSADRELNAQLEAMAPRTNRLAWIFIDSEKTDLSRTGIRRAVVEQARLLTSLGYQGIQFDYEICADGDQSLLRLLEETRTALPRGSILSVAGEPAFPWPVASIGWSRDYYRDVGSRCDQIAVMCYDSGMWLPRSYSAFVRMQATTLPAWARCPVLLGLPTYEKGGWSHWAGSENLRNGLRGLAGSQAGISIFADWTTDADEWRELR